MKITLRLYGKGVGVDVEGDSGESAEDVLAAFEAARELTADIQGYDPHRPKKETGEATAQELRKQIAARKARERSA